MEASLRPIPVTLRYRAARVDRVSLQRLLRHCLEDEGAPQAMGIGVVLGGGRLLRRLNREWRGRDAETDVLSFPYAGGPPLPPGVADSGLDPEARLLGEILVSIPLCFERSRTLRVAPGVELVRLLVHGALHVLGHDHELPAERLAMTRRERRLRLWAARASLGPGVLRRKRP